ncbi:MAG: hypothetical protein QOI86_4534 [Actinomycetota bacterium]|nr:hypothetical protein [Actinomycetota bacterium]
MDEPTAAGSGQARMGALAIRIWTEGARPDGFRARITSRLDISSDADDTVTVAADREAVISAVRLWLDAFVAG